MAYRVAVVTDELVGINRGGGIGTCANSLVRVLKELNCTVDIIITDPLCEPLISDFYGSKIYYLKNWIEEGGHNQIDHAGLAYGVYEMLQLISYDVVHFNDWRGSGYYFATAKRQGLTEAVVVTHLHGPTKWVQFYNNDFGDVDSAELRALEKHQIENSDYVVSPSRYLLDWYKSNEIKLPDARVINWILPTWLDSAADDCKNFLSTTEVDAGSINELVFFGRQERRKGFDLFLSAIKSDSQLSDIDITFVGRFDRFDREFTGSRVFRLLPNHKGSIKFKNNLNHTDAMLFLEKKRHALIVMPSIIENSPCVVGECFTIGMPFISTAVGGIPELVRDADRSLVLVEADYKVLAKKLVEVINGGLPKITSTLHPGKILENWHDFHNLTFQVKSMSSHNSTKPKVSVCLVHHNRTNMLRRALAGLSNQNYSNFEVVLVDDGSDIYNIREIDVIEKEDWPFPFKIIRSSNKYLGAARNLAAKSSSGEFLLFHDDDNVAEPNEIEMFIKAALAGDYDILTSQYFVFDDKSGPEKARIKFFPMGIGGSFSYFRNRFGDANALIRRSAFDQLGGFSELKNVGWEDWEFFLRAFIANMKLGIVPEPLFRYRISNSGMLSTTSPTQNHARMLSVVGSADAQITSDLICFAKRESIDQQISDYTWATLSKTEFAEFHHNLMALDPNSEEARHKLMELAFAMRRDADAIDLGLGLRHGFYKVSGIIEAMGPRARSTDFCSPVLLEAKTRTKSAILLRGWIGPSDSRSIIADEIVYKHHIYDVQ